MKRRDFFMRAAYTAAGFGILRNLEACQTLGSAAIIPGSFAQLRDQYFIFHLARNPVTSTYLGGDAYHPDLKNSNTKLRDYSAVSLSGELAFYRSMRETLKRVQPATLSAQEKVDYKVMVAQLDFLIHQLADLRYYERAVDTYVAEPFRGVDWQMQQMQDIPGGMLGSAAEWDEVVTRTLAIPAYLDAARKNLTAGKRSGSLPDKRMVQRDGIGGSKSNADYFRNTLAKTAGGFIGSRGFGATALPRITAAGNAAAAAWDTFAAFLSTTFDVNESADRFAAGEAEYEWRVKNVFGDQRSAAQLFEYGKEQVSTYTSRLADVARKFAAEAKLNLPFDTAAQQYAGIQAVMAFLSKDSPKDDDQLLRWYKESGERAVKFGRDNQLFDVPATYRLDVHPTPPVLRSTIDAAYYPAPPFKTTGVGRFYLTPTDNDPGALKQNNFASVADTAVHEGFPGHDWHFKYMTANSAKISNIRWLTPGAVEDSSSMWGDSLATEGWALYAEELMSQPTATQPYGFYSAGEYLYELQGQLLRAVRIVVDVGIHTRRISFDEAVDYFTEHVLFQPNARARASTDAAARAAMDSAGRAMYRYSKWPTQAIAYNLGKNSIVNLREAFKARRGSAFTAKDFHERFMSMGTIPVAYFQDSFLSGEVP
ncbi:MAG: DUF885 domain-containing protein [Gemmatimonadaceae bacterium]|nr:DUF885 domain-containing protein [Gemmatimonadaceae bacterium]